MDDIDAAFIAWVCRRHTWLWRAGYGAHRWKSKGAAAVARRAAVVLMRLDWMAWRLFVG